MSERPKAWDGLTGQTYGGESEPITAEDLKNTLREGITSIILISEQLATMTGIEKEKKEPGKLSRVAAINLLKAFKIDDNGLKLELNGLDEETLWPFVYEIYEGRGRSLTGFIDIRGGH